MDDNLAAIKPGPPCVSRWNTLWIRVLRIYVAIAQSSYQLEKIVTMLVKFSVSMWFQIKRHLYMVDSPHNTFVSLQLLKILSNTVLNIVKEVVEEKLFLRIQTNFYLPWAGA